MFPFDDFSDIPHLSSFSSTSAWRLGFLFFFPVTTWSRHGSQALDLISEETYTITFYDWHGQWKDGLILPQEEVREHPFS